MKTKALKFFPLIFAAALASWPTQTRANTIALDFTQPGAVIGAADTTFGWAFSLTSAVSLTDLGIWDVLNDGLNESHVVRIWDSTGNLITSGTVPSGMGGTLVNGFRYVSVAPTFLAAGSYVISAYYLSSNDPVAGLASVTTAPEVTYGQGRAGADTTCCVGGGDVFPTFLFPNGAFGPNFQFTTPTNGVPEPGPSLLLLGIALAGMSGFNLALRQRRPV
jgi:hypothetical protein